MPPRGHESQYYKKAAMLCREQCACVVSFAAGWHRSLPCIPFLKTKSTYSVPPLVSEIRRPGFPRARLQAQRLGGAPFHGVLLGQLGDSNTVRGFVVRHCARQALQRQRTLLLVLRNLGTCVDILGQYEDLGVQPCGARWGVRKGGKGAVRLPKILVLISSIPARQGGESPRAPGGRRALPRQRALACALGPGRPGRPEHDALPRGRRAPPASRCRW